LLRLPRPAPWLRQHERLLVLAARGVLRETPARRQPLERRHHRAPGRAGEDPDLAATPGGGRRGAHLSPVRQRVRPAPAGARAALANGRAGGPDVWRSGAEAVYNRVPADAAARL